MKILKSIKLIINLKTIVITIFSLIATFLCVYFELTADFPLTLIGMAVVFPIVFSISGAYKIKKVAPCLGVAFHHNARK